MNAHRILRPLGTVSLLGALCLSACGGSEAETLRPQAEAAPEAEPVAEPVAEAVAEPEPEPLPPDLTGWTVGTGHRGIHTLAWRLVDPDLDRVPRNVEFELEVLVLRDGLPQPDLRLAVTGWMPEHQHGLVRSPLIESLGDGRSLISGMLLHMRGQWQLRFQVFAGRDTETMTFDLEL